MAVLMGLEYRPGVARSELATRNIISHLAFAAINGVRRNISLDGRPPDDGAYFVSGLFAARAFIAWR